MRININNNDGLVNIKLSGNYDIEEIYFFSSVFAEQLNNNPSIIALNLGELNYIDSSGIGSLIRCMNMAIKENIIFLCYNLNENIKKTFKIAKLEQCFPILSEEEFLCKDLTDITSTYQLKRIS